VAQTVAVLREEIQQKRWRQWLPGENELCRQLHVSRVTLRGALKQLEREGLVKASQGRRREVVAQGRARRGKPTNRRVVLLTAEPLQSQPTFTVCWIDELREQLSDAGFHLEVHVSRQLYGARSGKALEALSRAVRPAAWVLYRSTLEMQQWFSTHALSGVITGSRHPGVQLPSVDMDYRATCRHAAGQFLAKGHRRLALLNPESGTGGELESEEGFREAVKPAICAGAEAILARHEGSAASVCKALDGLLRQPERPTALLVSRPVHVLTALGHLARRGIKVPREMAVISRDDDSFLEHVVPSVARYSSNPAAFAQRLSRVVLSVAESGLSTIADHKLMPRFVRGESFG
jgi:DNA-binding LacI/PurR family transcriptional regulator